MLDGDTQPDQNVVGYATAEQVTLTVFPAPTTTAVYELSAPTNSALAAISVIDDVSARFIPDLQGLYVVTATVDGSTEYVIRLSVSQFGVVTLREALLFPPVDPTNIAAPQVGRVLFSDSTNSGNLSVKLPNDTVVDLE